MGFLKYDDWLCWILSESNSNVFYIKDTVANCVF